MICTPSVRHIMAVPWIIATLTGTHGIMRMKVVLTHIVPAVGFDPRSLGFAV